MTRVLAEREIEDRMSGAEMREWRRDGNVLRRTIEAHDFPTVVRMLERIVVDTQRLDRRPDVDIRGGVVQFTLHSGTGLTDVDVELAHRIELGAGAFVRGHA